MTLGMHTGTAGEGKRRRCMSREAIPADIEREVLVEAGHRCAIPTCRHPQTQLHHIIPWARLQRHDAHNLIALCPNCHSRADRGEIDRKSVQKYKALLQPPLPNGVASHGEAGRNANGEYIYAAGRALYCRSVIEVQKTATATFPALFRHIPDVRLYPEGVGKIVSVRPTGFTVALDNRSHEPLAFRYVAIGR